MFRYNVTLALPFCLSSPLLHLHPLYLQSGILNILTYSIELCRNY